MLIFQIKRIISNEKWLFFLFFFENVKNLGRSEDAKRRKKEDGLTDEKSKIQATSEERVCALYSRKQAENAPLSSFPPPLPSPIKILDAPAGESVFKRPGKRPGTSRHILDSN